MVGTSGEGQEKGGREFQIQIDRVHYTVAKRELTGAELRQVPPTPIGPERDLFEVVPGGQDRKIEDADVVQIHNGQRFFTAPGQINPGSWASRRPRT
jgi:multiubiquitin